MSSLRIFVAVPALILIAAWFVLLRPTSLGGSATYLIVNGTSMEPTYESGDLVILREAEAFAVGDVVAFATQDFYQTGRLVIHRIVGGDETGFVTQGDNRSAVDERRPVPGEIRGEAWIHVPGIGRNLALLSQDGNLRVFLAALLVLFLAGSETARRGLARRRPPAAAATLVISGRFHS